MWLGDLRSSVFDFIFVAFMEVEYSKGSSCHPESPSNKSHKEKSKKRKHGSPSEGERSSKKKVKRNHQEQEQVPRPQEQPLPMGLLESGRFDALTHSCIQISGPCLNLGLARVPLRSLRMLASGNYFPFRFVESYSFVCLSPSTLRSITSLMEKT